MTRRQMLMDDLQTFQAVSSPTLFLVLPAETSHTPFRWGEYDTRWSKQTDQFPHPATSSFIGAAFFFPVNDSSIQESSSAV